ncbi:MAG: VCBS repeat-containing protein [Candidatus Sumerlaeota bacterium]
MKQPAFPGLLMAVFSAAIGHASPTFVQSWQDPVDDIFSNFRTSVSDVSLVAGVDTDGDGKKEIIYTRADWDLSLCELYIYENDGPDSFTLVYSDVINNFGSQQFSTFVASKVADVDNDGKQEIWITFGDPSAGGDPEIYVYENTGDNSWGLGQTAADNEYTQSFTGEDTVDTEFNDIAIGDVDNDGTVEIVVTDDEGNEVKVLTVNGDIGAGATMSVEADMAYPTGESPFPLTIDDFDGDGRKEILVGWFNYAGISIYESPSPNIYVLQADLQPGLATGRGIIKSECLAIADFGGGSRVCFFPNSEDGELYALGNKPDSSTLILSDLKLFVSNATLGLSDQNAVLTSDGSSLTGQSIAVGDADGNGRPEIYYGAWTNENAENSGRVFVIEYNGSGDVTDGANYTISTPATTGLSFPDYPGAVTPPVDLDGDGLPEIVVAGPDSDGEINSQGHAISVFELNASVISDWSLY